MMSSKKNHLSDISHVNRNLPVNFINQDLFLFQHELKKEIQSSYFIRINFVFLVVDTVVSIPKFRFYPAETHLNGSFSKQQKNDYLNKISFPFKIYPKAIWITQNWTWMYFHWMIDSLTRYVACMDYIKKHPVILPSSYKEYAYIVDSLDYLDIPYIWHDEQTSPMILELILPSHTASPGNYNVHYLFKLRSLFLSKQPIISKPFRKIFISRKKALTRRIINESEIYKLLVDNGIEIHCLEDYTLKNKIKLISETNCLIGMHGAGLTNMLFLPTLSKVLEIRIENDSHNNSYFSMASALNLPYYYFKAKLVNMKDDTNDVFIDLEQLKLTLNQILQ